jgi:putative oxidoreductase
MAEMDGDLALTIIRVAVGLIVAGHGAQKLFGWWGGQGLEKWSGAVANMGFALPRLFALLVAFTEFFGALMLAGGILTPLVCAALAVDMIVAIAKVHLSKGFWITRGGVEYSLALLVIFVVFGLHGSPRYSFDEFFGIAPYSAVAFVATFIAGGAITWLAMVTGTQHRPASSERTRSV